MHKRPRNSVLNLQRRRVSFKNCNSSLLTSLPSGQLQGQVVEKDKQLRETQFILEDSDLYRHHAAQEQLLQKTRELCDLQAQLTQELALRQSVQYKVIEKERAICELQKQLMQARGASNNSTESSFVRPSSASAPTGGMGARRGNACNR